MATDTYSLLSEDALNPGLSLASGSGGGVDLLPASTKVIPARYFAPRLFWIFTFFIIAFLFMCPGIVNMFSVTSL